MGTFLRNTITPISLMAFAAVGVTGLMMFFGVHGHQLRELHEWFGVAFVVIAILHMVRNGGGFAYMMGQTRSLIVIGILGVLAALLIGSALTPGFGRHGNSNGPPGFGRHALVEQRLTTVPIAQVAPALGLNGDEAVARLRAGGIAVDGPSDRLVDVERKTGTPAPRLLRLILAENDDGPPED